MSEDKNDLKINKLIIPQTSDSLSKIYHSKISKKTKCNCLCCKNCNIYWRPLENSKSKEITNPQKTIKFKKEFYCFKDCLNCKKYIHKKEKQWKEYQD